MTLKSIVTHAEPGTDHGGAAVDWAFALAGTFGAEVVALAYTVDVIGPTAVTDEEAAVAATQQGIRARAAQQGVSCTVADRSSFAYGIGEVFADHLRVSDLGVLRAGGLAHSGNHLLIDAALFQSGRPVLLVPNSGPAHLPQRALVAWDGSAAAARALHEALPLLALTTETVVTRVSDDTAQHPGQSGIAATRHLARHGISARFLEVPRDGRGVFDTLQATAEAEGCGLIVCGAVQHTGLHELIFGSVTKPVLAGTSRLPVLVST